MRYLGTIIALLFAIVSTSCGFSSNSSNSEEQNSTQGVDSKHTALRVELPVKEGFVMDTIHLGRVREGEIITSSFTISNKTDNPLVIVNIKTICGCATTSYDTKPIMQNQEEVINFTYNSKGRYGFQLKYFDIQFADQSNVKIMFDVEVE